jgi:hypothetical protein
VAVAAVLLLGGVYAAVSGPVDGEASAGPTPSQIAAFVASLDGDVLFGNDSLYLNSSQQWDYLFQNSTPQMVVLPREVSDVLLTVQFARAYELEFKVLNGGHGFESWATCAGCVLLNMKYLNEVIVDPVGQTAIVSAGALVGDVVREALAVGLVYPPGSCSLSSVVATQQRADVCVHSCCAVLCVSVQAHWCRSARPV